MISFTTNEFFTTVLAGPILVAAAIVAGVWAVRVAKNIHRLLSDHTIYKKRMKGVIAMKANGDTHEWVSIAAGTKSVYVCRKTGYCPDLNGFFDISYVEGIIKQRKQADEYNEYRVKRLAEIGSEYGLNDAALTQLVEKIINIRTDFTIQKLDSLQQELKGDKKE